MFPSYYLWICWFSVNPPEITVTFSNLRMRARIKQFPGRCVGKKYTSKILLYVGKKYITKILFFCDILPGHLCQNTIQLLTASQSVEADGTEKCQTMYVNPSRFIMYSIDLQINVDTHEVHKHMKLHSSCHACHLLSENVYLLIYF